MHSRAATCLAVVLAFPAYAADPPAENTPPGDNAIDPSRQLRDYMLATSAFLGAAQVDALSKIEDEDRRLLAMTYYLRAGSSIMSRWSWTSEQIAAYEKSTEYSAVLAEIKNISAHFSMENPEYQLHANTRIRSLDEQLTLWQTERSVGDAASRLRTDALATLAQAPYGATPNEVSIQRFRDFLTTWRAPQPTVMVPGLSLHGRGRAYDFQIRDKNGGTIADTDASTIREVWEDRGWSERLSHAVHASSDKFKGPLLQPHEPWHYEYQPDD